MTPEEMALILTMDAEAFAPISGKPSHTDFVRLREALTTILLQDGYKKTHVKHNLWGIITPVDDYLEAYKEAFIVTARIGAYPNPPKEEKYQTRKLKAIWNMRLEDYAIYDTGVHGASTFILTVVDPFWYQELNHPTTFYTAILPTTLLNHLEDRCTGLNAIDASDLPMIIQGYYTDASRMPIYINMLEDTQRRSKTTDSPLYDATLPATATKTVLALQEYPDETRKWERKAKSDKTWPDWKLLYKKAYELRQLAFQALDGAKQLGAANAATQAHSSASTQPTVRFDLQPPVDPVEFDRLDTYLNNLANTATNEREVISQLTAAVAVLTTANTELAETKKILTADNKKLRNKVDRVLSSRSGRSSSSGRTFTMSNPGYFIVGTYCHSHGFHLRKTHTIATCSNTDPNHKKEATRANTMGGSQDHIR